MPAVTSNPKINIRVTEADVSTAIQGRRDLIVGTVPLAVPASEDTLYTDVQSMTDAEIKAIFGSNTDVYNRINMWMKANEGSSLTGELHARVLKEEATGTNATASIVLGGTATTAGTMRLSLVDDKQFGVPISIAVGETTDVIISRLTTALADKPNMPVMVTSASSGSATNAILSGGATPDAVGTFTGITDGSIKLDIDGASQEATGLDFSAVASESDIAGVINGGLSGGTVSYSGTVYLITSDTTGDTSTIDFATPQGTGTDIGVKLKLTEVDGATVTDGADAVTDTINLTAVDKGTVGNNYTIVMNNMTAGITATINGFAGGAGDTMVTGWTDILSDIRYTGINWFEGWNDQVSELEDFLEGRWNVSNNVLDGVGFVGFGGTLTECKNAGKALNSKCIVYMGNATLDKDHWKGNSLIQPYSWTVAYFQGVRSRRLTDGADLTDFVLVRSSYKDNIGGIHTASLPYHNTPLDEISSTSSLVGENLFDEREQEELSQSGFSTFGINRAYNTVITGVMVTTYMTDEAGNANDSFKYLNYVDTASVVKEYYDTASRTEYVQTRLTDGTSVPDYAMENPNTIKAYLCQIYTVLSKMALTRGGADNYKKFRDSLRISATLSAGRVDWYGLCMIVTQLRVMNGELQLDFTAIEE